MVSSKSRFVPSFLRVYTCIYGVMASIVIFSSRPCNIFIFSHPLVTNNGYGVLVGLHWDLGSVFV